MWLGILVCAALLNVATDAGWYRGRAQASFPLPAIDPPGAKAAQQTPAPAPAAITPAPAAGQAEKPPAGNTAADAQKQKVAAECADLLTMATDLKREVDKSTKDMLSLTVVRKADQIEQLAHKLRVANGKS